ncbi:MAG: hypothetical protein WBA52_13260 [Dolichospermum sp.]
MAQFYFPIASSVNYRYRQNSKILEKRSHSNHNIRKAIALNSHTPNVIAPTQPTTLEKRSLSS